MKMKIPKKSISKSLMMLVLLLLMAASIPSLNAAFNGTKVEAASPCTTCFTVVSAQWGTSAAPVSAAPGDIDVPLVVTLQYLFSTTATAIQGYLQPPNGFLLYNNSNTAFASVTGTFPTDSTFQFTFPLDLASNLVLGSYDIPLSLLWTVQGESYIFNATTNVVVFLEGSPQLYFKIANSTTSLTPGQTNNLEVALYNNGTGTASKIFVSASAQSGEVLSTVPEIQTLLAGSQTNFTLQVFAPTTTAGGLISLSLGASYKDPYGNSGTASGTVYAFVSQLGEPKLLFSTTLQTVAAGQVDSIPVKISNIGALNLTQISTSISVQPQTVTLVTSFPFVQSLGQNSSDTYQIQLDVPASVANSAISLTISTTFTEPNGASGSASQTLGLYTTNTNKPMLLVSSSSSTSMSSLIPGQANSVQIVLSNKGTGTAYEIQTSVTTSSQSSATVLSISPSGPIAALQPNASVTLTLDLYLSASASNSPLSLSFTITYTDQYGDTQTASQVLNGYTNPLTKPMLLVSASSSSSLSSLSPGQANLVQFFLTNKGSGVASQISTVVSVSPQTSATVLSISPSGLVSALQPGSNITLSMDIYISSSASNSPLSLTFALTYTDQYGDSETATQVLNGYITANEPDLQFSTSVETLTPGQVNQIPVSLSNVGPIALSRVSTTVTISPQAISLLDGFQSVTTIDSGSTVNSQVSIYIPSTEEDTAISITFTSSYLMPGGIAGTFTQTIGFFTSTYVSAVSNASVVLEPLQTNVTAGQQSKVSFMIENDGSNPVYSPTVSLTVASPLVMVANSSFSYSHEIMPKSSVEYEAVLTASPSATLGSYGGTLSVSISDQLGDSRTLTFAVGFTLTGRIDIVVQSEQISQSSNSLSVSGTLLNEGTASAYYVSISGCTIDLNVTRTTSTSEGSSSFTTTLTTGSDPPNGTFTHSFTGTRNATTFTGTQTSFGNFTFTHSITSSGSSTTTTFTSTTFASTSETTETSFVTSSFFAPPTQSSSGIGLTSTAATGETSSAFSTSSFTRTLPGTGGGFPSGSGAPSGGQGCGQTGSSTYVGEVDPNTPVAFTATVQFAAKNTSTPADVILDISYLNNFGNTGQMVSTKQTTIQPSTNVLAAKTQSSQPQSTSDDEQTVKYAFYAVIAAIVVCGIVGGIFVRKSRKSDSSDGSNKVI